MKNLAFVGGRGAGKSKISRKFAKMTGRVCLSTDTLISYEAGGLSIPNLVKERGWPGFRELEYEVLKKVCRMQEIVIDCGGGILFEAPLPGDPEQKETLSARKLEVLKETSILIYIKRDIPWLMDRGIDATRPELIGDYKNVVERRLPYYESSADLIVDMKNLSAEDAIDQLVSRFGITD